ncbi:Legumain [Aphelenchoides besseyi]|nr:Legumain [Aphelenchoides besseyi]
MERSSTINEYCSKAEWFKLSKEMLKAIEQFHSMSLAHGAIRLDAFAVTPDDSIVLTDFALARNNPETETPEKLEFYNPPNVFSSRAVHENIAVCCADDMESWVYCIFSLYDRNILPWNTRTQQIAQHHNIPTAFGLFLVYISDMKRNKLPNHSHFYKILNTTIPFLGITGQETFHWHDKGAQSNDLREIYQPRNTKQTKHPAQVGTLESCTGHTKTMRQLVIWSLILLTATAVRLRSPENLGDESEDNIWALLVAGSSGWWNYRHQADICHSFHVLRNHGVKEDHIVTMLYDDIANNSANPYPGKIFNAPNGKDVYANVKIDYRGDAVTPENFLAVLQGQKSKVKGGNGRVLETGKQDRIFLTVKQLNNALKDMYKNGRYNQLTFYLEACESGSMFEKVLPQNINVYAMTAANSAESSFGCYCGTSAKLSICLGDSFSVNWLQDSDAENLHTESLEKQYEVVKNETKESHVQKFGTLSITSEPVADFQGEEDAPPQKPTDNIHDYEQWPSRDIPIKSLEARMKFTNSEELQRSLAAQIAEIHLKRKYLHEHVLSFVRKLIHDPNIQNNMMERTPGAIKNLDCHHDIVHVFNRICFRFGSNPYATNYVKVLANLCDYGLETERILRELMDHCLDIEHTDIL